jgi:glycosyltransferase involved in cell wall biosynthesis
MPQITFIMPVYNGAKYLHDSINSIHNTVLGIEWELLIVDDCSTDQSAAMIKHKVHDARIRAWFNNVREGAAEARNRLIQYAQSEILYILDCDNILEPYCVEKMFNDIKERDVVAPERIKFFGFKHKQSSFIDGEWKFDVDLITLREMLCSHKVPPSSGNYMLRKKVWNIVDGYHKDDIQETWGFGFRHILRGFPIWICKGTSYLHRFCHQGYYNELPKEQMKKAYKDRLNDIRGLLTEESQAILDGCDDGKQLIAEERLKLK